MKTETEIKFEMSTEKIKFEALRKAIEEKAKKVYIGDYDSLLDLDSDVQNLKNSFLYFDGLKFASSEKNDE